jgi:carboxypeptidase Q
LEELSNLVRWIFVLVLLAQIAYSQNTDSLLNRRYMDVASKIAANALTDQKGYEWLRELCDIGPRLSGSENSLKAIQWAKEKMEGIGLDQVTLQPVMVPHWQRGKIESAEIIDSGQPLNISALGGSIATPPEGLVAEVLEVSSFEELESRANEAQGKIIFFNHAMNSGWLNTFEAYEEAVEYRVFGATRAAKSGGVAALIRSVTTRYDDVPHVGVMSYSDSVKKVPTAALSLIAADRLSNALKKNPDLKVKLDLSCRTLPDAESYNVIGEIVGSEKPEEIILVGGHLDSWDKGDGAHDDGAGCIQTLEVLDLLKRLNITPKRTIRCILFINEENGSRGARKYSEVADSSQTEIHIAAIEADMGAFSPRGFAVDSDPSGITYLTQWLPYLNQSGIDWIQKGHSGVDISRIKNCPLKIGYTPDSQRYFDYHHSDNDVFHAVNPREFELGSASIAILAYLLSEEGSQGRTNLINKSYTH